MLTETYTLTKTGVIRGSDSANIPNDAHNTDWRDYLEWVGLGNTPNPITVSPPLPLDEEYARLNVWVKALIEANPKGVAGIQSRVQALRER